MKELNINEVKQYSIGTNGITGFYFERKESFEIGEKAKVILSQNNDKKIWVDVSLYFSQGYMYARINTNI